jgi:hypothetical protein
MKTVFSGSFSVPVSDFIHQITMPFRCRAGGFENIALAVLQCFQPGSDIALMLNLSGNPQICYQECTSQLGDQRRAL